MRMMMMTMMMMTMMMMTMMMTMMMMTMMMYDDNNDDINLRRQLEQPLGIGLSFSSQTSAKLAG